MNATIDLGLNASPFEQGLATAERRAQSFQGRLQQLFRRDPNHRAGAALGGFVGDLASGNLQSAVVGLTTRMRGLGLGLTVAAVAGIELYQGIKKARQEGDALAEALDKVNRSSGPAELNTAENLTSKLAGIREEREKLIKQEESYGPLDMLSDLTNPKNAGSSPLDNLRIAQERRATQAARGFAAERQAMSDLAAKYRTVAGIEEERIHGSERLAEIQKSEKEFSEKYGPLIQAGPNQNPEAAAELKRAHELDLESIHKKFDLKKQEEEVENRILNLHASSLTKEQQSVVALRERIGLLKERLSGPGSDEEKTHIGTQLHGLENQEAMARYQESLKPESQKKAEEQAQEAYRRWVKRDADNMGLTNVHRDMNGRVIGGTDSITREQERFSQPSALDELNGHMSPPGHMTTFGGSGEFNQFFHGGSAKDSAVITLGAPGVLDRIEKKLDDVGANR